MGCYRAFSLGVEQDGLGSGRMELERDSFEVQDDLGAVLESARDGREFIELPYTSKVE